MTQLRKGSFIRKAKDITIGSALALTLLSAGFVMPGCSTGSEEDAYSYEETTYSKGVRSYIKEIKPGEFKITDEESVPADKSGAVVSYLDGHTDTLSIAASKALIDDEIRANPGHGYHHSRLSSMLLWGGIGYMLGRNSGNGYINSYRDRDNNGGRAAYATPAAYSRSQAAASEVNASRSTRIVKSRPSGGRSGFFGSSRSRSGG